MKTNIRNSVALFFGALCLLWSTMAFGQTGPVRIGIYQYQGSSASQQLPNPPTIQTAYENAFGANNVTISFVKAQQPWVTPTDLPNVDVLWISRYRSQAGSAQELELISNFVKNGKHVVFSSIETHGNELSTILGNIIGRSVTVSQATSGSNPFPNPTNLFGLATGLNDLRNTSSYDRYTNIPACNLVAHDSLFLVPSTTVRGGTLFVSGEIQSFSSISTYNTASWRTLAERIADLHRVYMYGAQADLVAKDATNYLSSPCANDFVVAPNAQINAPANGSSTNDTTPTISGVVGVNNTVVVTIEDSNGAVVQTVSPTVAGDGTWSFDANQLPEGTYTVRATASNTNGDMVDATPSTFTVDTTIPTLNLTNPADGSTVFSATPAITGDTEVGATVTVTIRDENGAVVQTLNPTVDAQGDFTINAALPEGAYTVEATATDAAGNTSLVAGPNNFTVEFPRNVLIMYDEGFQTSGVNSMMPKVFPSPQYNRTIISNSTNVAAQNLANIDILVVSERGALSLLSQTAIINFVNNGGNVLVASDSVPTMIALAASFGVTVTGQNVSGRFTAETISNPAFGVKAGAYVRQHSGMRFNGVPAANRFLINSNDNTDYGLIVGGGCRSLTSGRLVLIGEFAGPVGYILENDPGYPDPTTYAYAPNEADFLRFHTEVINAVNCGKLFIAQPTDNALLNDNTPTISGTADPGAAIVLTLNDSNMNALQVINVVADAQGDWSVDAGQLPDGTYTVRGVATDVGGVITADGPVTFTIDTTAPALTIATPANNTSTNDNTPTVSGTSETGATLTVLIKDANGATVQTLNPTVDAQGNYTIDAAQLPDGTYTVEATAVDAAGNSALAGPNSFTVDTLGPALTLDTPANNSFTDDTPTIGGTGEVGAAVVIQIMDANGATVQTLNPTVDAQGNYTIDAAQLPDGTYTASATATDAAGNVTSAGPTTFTVDATPPSVTLATPADGAQLNDNTPSVTGTTEAGATVTVLIKDANGATVETLNPAVDAQGNYTIDAAQLADGTYTVEVTATDAAGNSALAGPNGFTIDTAAPSVTLATPADGAQLNDNTPSVTGTTEAGATVTVLIKDANGATVQTLNPMVDAQGNYAVDAAQLPDGAYTVEATATDAAGNTSGVVGPNGFTIDTTAPSITLTSPTDGLQTSDTTPTIGGVTEAGATVTVLIKDANGATVQTLNPMVDAQGNYAVDAAQLMEGAYTVEATATDAAGNTATAGPNSFVVDATAPTLTLDTPTDGTTSNDDTPTITGTTEPGATVEVTITDSNGAVVQTLNPTVDAQGNYTVDAAQLPEGDYTISATATDGAGNQASQGPVALNIDLTAPALSITTPSMGELIGTRNVDVSGSSEPNQTMIAVEIIDANGVVVDTQTVNADANGDWTLQTQGLANGDYTARAKTSDAAGNEATAEQTFTVDSDEPLITIDAPAADTVTNEVRPAINGTADTDGVVTVVVTDGQGNEVANVQPTVDAQGNWTVALDADLADGDYTITATSTRPNGKMASASVDVTIDTMGPDTVISTPADGMTGNANQPEISGTSEPGATVDVTVTNAAGTIVFTGQVTADDQGNWSVTPDSPLADDEYTISATSTDAAGNEGTPATSTFTVDTNAPMVTVTSPSNGDTVEDTTPTITGTAEPGATVTVIIDGMDAGQATADDQGVWSFDVTDELAEGDHTIEAKTTDDAGNEGSSGELTVTIAEPKAPVTITTPTDGGDVTGPDVTVTGTGEPGEEVTVTVGGETQTVTVDENGDWTVTFNDVPEGDQTIDAGTGDRMAPTVNVKVTLPDATQFVLKGGSCSSTNGSPTSSLWLLGLVGLLALRRRRR